jgi:AraC family transcriptional regulator of adaptative response/methylated-DNA-[protein]-cysteine methyltransferase
MQRLPPLSEMHRAVQSSDSAYDGLFFVAVRSTRIFCRPSCPSRPAKPSNRSFFATVVEARAAGYRPCKRCWPLDCSGRPPEWLQALLEAVEDNPSRRWPDSALRTLGVDPTRARRYFRQHYSMTFQEYSRRRRMGQALRELGGGEKLDRVALSNGYESHSGFRDAFGRTFGGPPGRQRDNGTIITAQIPSPIGPLAAGATEEGICLLEFAPHTSEGETWLSEHFGRSVIPGNHPLLDRLRHELAAYFARRLRVFTVPVVTPGTKFQRSVWKALSTIPYGETRSYADIARQVRCSKAVRAVGQANGRNRVAIIIPCHRVVNSGGRLGGYGGGLWRKQFLLDLERA